MMWEEFNEMAKMEISYNDYKDIVEPMYLAAEKMTKQEFIDFIKPSVRPLAKKYKEERKKATEKLVWYLTSNWPQEKNRWMIQEDIKISVKTGVVTYILREATEEEIEEKWDSKVSYTADENSIDTKVRIRA